MRPSHEINDIAQKLRVSTTQIIFDSEILAVIKLIKEYGE